MENIIEGTIANILSTVLIGIFPLFFLYFSERSFKDFILEFKNDRSKKNKRNISSDASFYKIGDSPGNEHHIADFKAKNIVSIGWPLLGDLSKFRYNLYPSNILRDEVKKRINNIPEYANVSVTTLGQIAGYFDRFLSIKKGDIVCVPSTNGNLSIFIVTEPYHFINELTKQNMAHAIGVKIITELNIHALNPISYSPKFKRVLQNRLTIISLENYDEQMRRMLNEF